MLMSKGGGEFCRNMSPKTKDGSATLSENRLKKITHFCFEREMGNFLKVLKEDGEAEKLPIICFEQKMGNY